ncbi:response regulator [Bacillus sp. RO1]|uniref:response regulator n=1 Tax=Bacillus sp. RO1 TaxID=2722703 RepID=UPI001456C911|nr:response regulator [Bacillus sp. RO1]NLP51412.1 response regulator [Bacillus sp. RO1]
MSKRDSLIKVLLIEDDPMVQHVNKLFIEKIEGFAVSGIASSGVEGKTLIKVLEPDLVLLDVYMPGQDGLSLIQELRQEQIDVDIIAVTAANDTNTVKAFMRNGVIDYIVKPFTFDRMEKAFLQYKEVYKQLYRESAISQDKWDEVMSSAKKETLNKVVEGLPKGLQEQTLNQVYNYVKRLEGAQSAEEIGKKVGLARVTTRRYLNYLESVGKVEMELIYGTIGRPIQMYRIKG